MVGGERWVRMGWKMGRMCLDGVEMVEEEVEVEGLRLRRKGVFCEVEVFLDGFCGGGGSVGKVRGVWRRVVVVDMVVEWWWGLGRRVGGVSGESGDVDWWKRRRKRRGIRW